MDASVPLIDPSADRIKGTPARSGVFQQPAKPKSCTVWYYSELARIFSARLGSDHPLVLKLEAALKRWAF